MEALDFLSLQSGPDSDEECLQLAVSFIKILYWLLIVSTRLLKLCIEVCKLYLCTPYLKHHW